MPLSSLRRLAPIQFLAWFSALFLLFAPPVAATEAPSAQPPETEAGPGDWGSFGVQTQWMDREADPGDDFDRFVNGAWSDSVAIPADKTRIGAFIQLRDLSEERLRGILEGLAAQQHEPDSPEARISAAYQAFMDVEGIEAAGLAPARPYLDDIFAAESVDDLIALFVRPGFAAPLGVAVEADEKQSDRYALYVVQSGLGLPDRDYYLADNERYETIRAKYREYLAFVLGQAGYKDAKGAADAVYSLEYRMAQEMWDRAVQRNRDLVYNKLTREELEALGPGDLVARLLEGLELGEAREAIVVQLPPTGEELEAAGIDAGEAAAKLGGGVPASLALIEEVPLSTWKAYLAAHFLSDHAAYLPKAIDDATFAFYGKVLNGQEEQRPRWKRGIDAVEGQIGELLGRIYAERYYPPENEAAMSDLVANLRKAMKANLADLEWMGPETRAEAEAKLAAFTPKIGAPDEYKSYDGLAIAADAPLSNQLEAQRWEWDYKRNRLGQEVDRGEWFMLPQMVNAYYYPTFNEVVFPAAILQPPFFNVDADPAVNYGAIGAVIGHEMGHGFDDQGAKSDGQGNLRDWWTPQDKANFQKLQKVLVEQFNGFCPFDEGKTCVNGKLTLGENIGDLGGLSLAYRAYKLSLEGQEAPVIDGFTGDQRFFLAWAQVWRAKAREELERQHLVTDPHSPPKYRINGIVRNFDEWYRAFDVTSDDTLYLPPDERVRIW